MSSVTKFQVRDDYGTISTQNNVRDAVLAAAGYDGYGAVYKRDENGAMRLYSSRTHIGNNIYFPKPNEAFAAESMLNDDELAEIAVAIDVMTSGVLHSNKTLEIAVLTFKNDLLTDVDGKSVEALAEEWDVDVSDVRKMYN